MLKVGDTAIVNTDDGRLYKGCEVVILLDMGEKAKRVGDPKSVYVRTKDGNCCAWYDPADLQIMSK